MTTQRSALSGPHRPPTATPTGTSLALGPTARFSGWRILAVAIVTSILTGPGQTIGVSVFIDPMVEALGIGRSAVSGAYLIGTLIGASAMPFFGRFVDRRGVRRAQILVGVAFAVALANMAAVGNLVWLAVGFAGIRMMGQGALSMISTVSVSLWFHRRRGVAMGLLATMAGAGIMGVPLALNATIAATSWRLAWLLAAGFVLATVVPLGWFGLIDRPAAVGQVPDGVPAPATVGPSGEARGAGAAKSGEPGDADAGRWWTGLVPGRSAGVALGVHDAPALTRDQAVRTRQFWILASVSTTVGMLITGLNFHQIDLLGEAGLSSSQAAAMFLPQIIGSSATGIAVGWLIDRVGVRYVPAFAMALLIVVHVLGASLSAGPLVFLYAISLGATAGAARATAGTLLPGYFGTDHIGSIQGVLTVCGVAGSAAGPVTMALAEGWLGSYRAANLALMTLPIVALAFTLTNRPIDTQAA